MAVIRRKNKNKDAIAKRAHLGKTDGTKELVDLAISHGLQTAPLDVESLIQVLDIELKKEPLDRETSGMLQFIDSQWTITVNSLHHYTRQRFTMAHELAHYILHRDSNSEFTDAILLRNGNRTPMEYEADDFAGELLMPSDMFLSFIKEEAKSVESIAAHFEVSPLAVRFRAKKLNLLNQEP